MICSCFTKSGHICHEDIFSTIYIPFATGATAHTGAYFGEGSGPIHLGFVQSSGSEYNLTECEIRHDRIRIDHSFDVGVKCQPGRAHTVT